MVQAIKRFEISECSLNNGWYRIEVYFRGILIQTIARQTMADAQEALRASGYEMISWRGIGQATKR